jgi:hypothetical protein
MATREVLWLLGKMGLVALTYFAMAHLGMAIERHRWSTKWQAWNEGDDDDFEPPESWFGLTLVRWHLQYVRGYSRIRQAFYCWWHKLVPVPPGSVKVERILVGLEDQLTGSVPSEIFTPEGNPRLSMPIVEPGGHISLVFRNTSKLRLRVESMAICRTGGNQGMIPLPFPSVDLLPDGTETSTARPVRPISIERILISVPKHLPKAMC